MADFTAKDVQALRQSTGAGMMDAKKALTETDGDMEAARKLLREKGLAKADDRAGRENAQGAIALASDDSTVGLVELKCETDFVAKSDNFIRLTQELADSVAARGEGAVGNHKDEIDDLKVTLKENIEVGQAVQISVEAGEIVDTYLHRQDGRGVNGVVVVIQGGSKELAHDLACTSPSPSRSTCGGTRSRPTWSRRSATRCSPSPRPRASPSRPGPRSSRAA